MAARAATGNTTSGRDCVKSLRRRLVIAGWFGEGLVTCCSFSAWCVVHPKGRRLVIAVLATVFATGVMTFLMTVFATVVMTVLVTVVMTVFVTIVMTVVMTASVSAAQNTGLKTLCSCLRGWRHTAVPRS